MSRTLFILIVCFGAGACREVVSAVPEQRAAKNYRAEAILYMDPQRDSSPFASVVQGVQADEKLYDWRWTDQHPVFKFDLDQVEGLELETKLTTIDAVLSKTGAQRVNFVVNGIGVKTLTYDHAGTYELHIPIAAGILKPNAGNSVELAIDPCLPQAEGPPFCVLAHWIGFRRQAK